MNSILDRSIQDLRAGLDAREFSSKEVVQAALERIEGRRDLNSFVDVCPDAALKQADEADARIAKGDSEPLLGVPVGIKDLIVTSEGSSTAGSKILEGYQSPFDATVVKKLHSSGAVVIGKTNMDEFAMGSSNENSAYGPSRNPWDHDRVPGGSSGGSAVAVADRQVPFALGTDTGGSIRQPAAFCGITGLKPTYGRVSRWGLIAFASSLDQAGCLTRDVSDCALVTEAISGFDPLDSTSVNIDVPEFSAQLSPAIKGLRIGIPSEYFIEGLDPEVEAAVRTAIDELKKLGATIVEVSLPHTAAAVAAYYIIAPAEASSNLARFDGVRYGQRAQHANGLLEMYRKTRSEGFGTEVKRRVLIGTYVLSTGYYDAYYLKAQKVRTLICDDFAGAFSESCDVIVCPTAPTTAFSLGSKVDDPVAMYLNDVFTIPTSLAGLPGLSIPCGFDSSGLPIGLQIIGKPWEEQTVLNAGYAFQQVTDWHLKRPQEV